MDIFNSFNAVLSAILPRAKKVCRLVWADDNDYGYINMVLPKDFDKFIVYTQEMGKKAVPSSVFKGFKGINWYDVSEWDSFRDERISEGWEDVTDKLVDRNKVLPKESKFDINEDRKAARILKRLKLLAEGLSIKRKEEESQVESLDKFYNTNMVLYTKRAIADGKKLLKALSEMKLTDDTEKFVKEVNSIIRKLYIALPRLISESSTGLSSKYLKMSGSKEDISKEFNSILNREKENFENIKNVSENELKKLKRPEMDENSDTLATVIDGNKIIVKNPDETLIKEVKDRLRSIAKEYKACWRVINETTEKEYNDDFSKTSGIHQAESLLWHGSRTENWIKIIGNGLKIIPDPEHGRMFGDGIYFAVKAAKSKGYTSVKDSKWSSGTDSTGFMALYKVRTGKTLDTKYSQDYNVESVNDKGFDCVYAHKGSQLMEDEVIIYKENQCTIFALVEIGID